jgi:hypothetical protein
MQTECEARETKTIPSIKVQLLKYNFGSKIVNFLVLEISRVLSPFRYFKYT